MIWFFIVYFLIGAILCMGKPEDIVKNFRESDEKGLLINWSDNQIYIVNFIVVFTLWPLALLFAIYHFYLKK